MTPLAYAIRFLALATSITALVVAVGTYVSAGAPQ